MSNLSTTLVLAFRAARERIHLHCDQEVHFTIYGWKEDKIEIQLANTSYGTSKIEVTGTDLDDCVDEFLRRAGFQQRQSNLQIAPPTLQAEPQRAGDDDAIPF